VVIAVIMVFTGILLAVISALSMVEGAAVNWVVPLVVGAILCIAGFVLLITELLETWLSRGQKALVDGLQAG
jgi:uncharacterized membrane protein HdeD (DUF308 family)